ncbi:MAG: hypothetical protein ACXVYA_03680 [Mycobacterium sp.]
MSGFKIGIIGAGVSAELHVFARTCHGFDSLLPDWSTSERLFALQAHAPRSAFDETGAGPSPLL